MPSARNYTFHLRSSLEGSDVLFPLLQALRRLPRTVANEHRIRSLRRHGARIGERVYIHPSARFTGTPANLVIGSGCTLGNSEYYSFGPLVIGDRVLVGDDVYICTGTHVIDHEQFPARQAPVTIGSDVWLATRCSIIGPTVVGDGAVVGLGSVVHGIVPERSVVAGNPARPVRIRETLSTVEPYVFGSVGSYELFRVAVRRIHGLVTSSGNK